MKIAPFRLERYFDKYEFHVKHLLCGSDCESMSIADLLAMEPGADAAFQNLRLGYTEAPGAPALREAIAALYTGLLPEDILVHAGAEEAIYNTMQVLLNAGDHVIVQSPCYQSLAEVARSLGAEVSLWTGDPEKGWCPDLHDLEKRLRPETRLVVVNNPHNPTGALMSLSAFEALISLSRENGFMIFSDEVYRGLESSPALKLPALCEVDDTGLSLGVMSKTYGLAGLRIGWIATRNRPVRARLAAMKDYTSICNSAPSEFLATVALHHAETLADRNRALIASNLDLLDRFFASRSDRFAWQRPLAGPIAFPRDLNGPVDAFCKALVEQAGVLLLPGSLYGPAYADCFRIGFGRASLPEALSALEDYLGSVLT